MIIHPERDRAHLTVCGGRLLEETFELVGKRLRDLYEPRRLWRIDSFYLPIRGRAVGGVRARLVDDKGFVTFCNQRDLEVLVGLAEPGDWCPWLGRDYVGPGDREWLGLCVDREDLLDDLFVREVELRALQQTVAGHDTLPAGIEITRRIHVERGADVEELLYLREDADVSTGLSPDRRIETIDLRWVRVERTNAPWKKL